MWDQRCRGETSPARQWSLSLPSKSTKNKTKPMECLPIQPKTLLTTAKHFKGFFKSHLGDTGELFQLAVWTFSYSQYI